MDELVTANFFYWIRERHAIYQRRVAGAPGPWTIDPILQNYKFTNPFRENDAVTIWMRDNWTHPNWDKDTGTQIFNICLFRMFGTTDFAKEIGYQTSWEPERIRLKAAWMLSKGLRVFTGAYIITNMGLKEPKQDVVVDRFLTPIWEQRAALATAAEKQSLEYMHKALGAFPGWGGGGFMAYEAVTDMNYTPVLSLATDKNTWANAGPGAVRGLNRLHDRPLDKAMKQAQANTEMQELLALAPNYLQYPEGFPYGVVDMRTIEHSLCEWDKYQRVTLAQGKPRSKYDYKNAKPILKGPVP